MDWWRSWHGAPMDPKWLLIARHSNMLLYGSVTSQRHGDVTVTPVTVAGISWAMMDAASQNIDRGSVTGFDPEVYALWAGLPPEIVTAVVQAMEDKNIIENKRFVNWLKRQGKDNDGSAERTRRWRERLKSEGVVTVKRHGDVTEAKIREDKRDIEAPKKTSFSPEFEEFWRDFPKARIGNKEKAFKAYQNAISSGRGTIDEIKKGLQAYGTSDEVANGYAKGAQAWLNDDRWRISYQSLKGSTSGLYDIYKMPSPAGG